MTKHAGKRPKLTREEKAKRQAHRVRTGRNKPDPRNKKVPGDGS